MLLFKSYVLNIYILKLYNNTFIIVNNKPNYLLIITKDLFISY